MKNLFFLLFLFSSAVSAQYVPQRTKTIFNSFVEKPSVEWAAYANETFSFPAFSEILFSKYKAGRIKGYFPAEYGTPEENKLRTTSFKDFGLRYNADQIPMFDSSGKEIKKYDHVADQPTELQKVTIEFYRFLFIEKGKLQAYISRSSFKTPVITPNGDSLGVSELISFNINNLYRATQKGKLTLIGETVSTLKVDSIASYQILKQLYGRNLIQTLWPAVLSGKIKVYSGDQKLCGDSLAAGNYPGAQSIAIAIYDSLGNPMGTSYQYYELNGSNFDRIALTEKWYYDEARDIILCMIPEAVIYKKTFSATEEAIKFRLVF